LQLKHLLLISPNYNYIKMAKNKNFYLIVILDKRNGNLGEIKSISNLVDELYVIDFEKKDKLDSIIELINNNNNLVGAFYLGRDQYMESVYEILGKYELNLNPTNSIKIMNDKYETRKYLNEKNISSVKFNSVTFENIDAVRKEFEFPFILKPTNMSGSRGVLLCEKESDIEDWKEYINSYDGEYSSFILEEYLIGQEVSVESISYNGVHYIQGVTDKIKTNPPYFVELGHIFPSQLEEGLQSEIKDLVINILNQLEYQFGPVHTEVIITSEGPKIVEFNTRLAGDNIPKLIEYSTEKSPQSLIVDMFNGEEPYPHSIKTISKIHFFNWKPGRIKSIDGIEGVRNLPSVKEIDLNFKVGSEIGEIWDSSRRHGFVIVCGDNIDLINNEIDKIETMIKLTYFKKS
jgi:D-alanine-D-alanine ligase-like ATP-grasp enzyme